MMPETPNPPTPPSYDALTLALTRPRFLLELRELLLAGRRSGAVFSICLVDVDGLRAVNEERGLAAGDLVLNDVADRLRVVLAQPAWQRATHTLARYDGDELVVLSRPCGPGQAELLAEALRFAVAEQPVGGDMAVTVSIGVTQCRVGETADELLGRASRALNLAKQFGRDRVEVAATPASRVERAKVVGLRD
jgi:diguanylate cyclase (GGDEF)-like protein